MVYKRELILRPWQEVVGKLCEFKVSSEAASFILSINSSSIVMEIPVNIIECDFSSLKKSKGKRMDRAAGVRAHGPGIDER